MKKTREELSRKTPTRATLSFELKASSAEERTFEGLAAAWSLDSGNDIIHPGAFAQTIARWKQAGEKRVIPLIDQHNYGSVRAVVGRIVELEEVEAGLRSKFAVIEGQDGDEILARVKSGCVNGLSIGYRPLDFSFEERDDVGLVRHLKEVSLEEVSLVIWGMNPDALVDPDSLKAQLALVEAETKAIRARLEVVEKKDDLAPETPAPGSALSEEAKSRLRARVAILLASRSAPREMRQSETRENATS